MYYAPYIHNVWDFNHRIFFSPLVNRVYLFFITYDFISYYYQYETINAVKKVQWT